MGIAGMGGSANSPTTHPSNVMEEEEDHRPITEAEVEAKEMAVMVVAMEVKTQDGRRRRIVSWPP